MSHSKIKIRGAREYNLKDIQKALCDISDLEFVERKPTMIRIES